MRDPFADGWDAAALGKERAINPHVKTIDKMQWFAGFDQCTREAVRSAQNARTIRLWGVRDYSDA